MRDLSTAMHLSYPLLNTRCRQTESQPLRVLDKEASMTMRAVGVASPRRWLGVLVLAGMLVTVVGYMCVGQVEYQFLGLVSEILVPYEGAPGAVSLPAGTPASPPYEMVLRVYSQGVYQGDTHVTMLLGWPSPIDEADPSGSTVFAPYVGQWLFLDVVEASGCNNQMGGVRRLCLRPRAYQDIDALIDAVRKGLQSMKSEPGRAQEHIKKAKRIESTATAMEKSIQEAIGVLIGMLSPEGSLYDDASGEDVATVGNIVTLLHQAAGSISDAQKAEKDAADTKNELEPDSGTDEVGMLQKITVALTKACSEADSLTTAERTHYLLPWREDENLEELLNRKRDLKSQIEALIFQLMAARSKLQKAIDDEDNALAAKTGAEEILTAAKEVVGNLINTGLARKIRDDITQLQNAIAASKKQIQESLKEKNEALDRLDKMLQSAKALLDKLTTAYYLEALELSRPWLLRLLGL
jgi:hypothetical protein